MELNAFLRSYRSTPHSSTKAAPADLLFMRPNHCRLPKYQPKVEPAVEMAEAQAHDADSKAKMKHYSDRRRNAKAHNFVEGNFVLLDKTKGKKIWSKKQHKYDIDPWVVTAIKGPMVTAMAQNGRELTRDASWFKRCTSKALIKSPLEVEPELHSGPEPEPRDERERRSVNPQISSDIDAVEAPSNDSLAPTATPRTHTSIASYAEAESRQSQTSSHETSRPAPPSPNHPFPQQQRKSSRIAKPVDRFEIKHAVRGEGLR
ncbi:Retrovirus-related Pol poly from transposon [Brachionus plicatilis]|uniref:Retrovirus-related Pol poly from transposon n=1 Tax=Brachionus plicatilis TaxID=10195 RepID=A0A3M7PRK8_BRAPC|nr:Retrovirus-related Pol poly from transposon [Brachionus plicatilis]